MGYYIPSSLCSGTTVPDYSCNDCPSKEFGRIRSWFFIKKTYLSTVLANPTSSAVWITGLSSGNIITLNKTQGSYDGGSTQELTGFGDDPTFNGNTTHSADIIDVNYADNCDFWNAVRNSSEYTGGFRTSSKIHFISTSSTVGLTISPSNPVADDINSIVGWKAKMKWTSPDSPCAYSTPDGIFTNCINHS